MNTYYTHIVITAWDKKKKDFVVLMINRNEYKSYSLPRFVVDINKNNTALDIAKKSLENNIGIKGSMFRHIAVFDDLKTSKNEAIMTNLILAIVDIKEFNKIKNEKYIIFSLSKLDNIGLHESHREMIEKFKIVVDYDIYCQIFDTQKFGSDFITSLLGKRFTTSELIALAKWAGRRENNTTFYRNIDNNYKFIEKVGRNKYYEKP